MYLVHILFILQSISPRIISNIPIKENALSLSVKETIKNSEFYDKLEAEIDSKGNFFIFDYGNYQISIYDSLTNLIHTFGKQGNGPGELSSMPIRIFPIGNNIIVEQRKLMIFDYQGKLLSSAKRELFDEMVVENGKIIYYQGIEYETGNLKTVYDFNGIRTDVIKRNKKIKYTNTPLSVSYADNQLFKTLTYRYSKPQNLTKLNAMFIQRFMGEYKFQILNDNLNPQIIIQRPFKRINQPINLSNDPNDKAAVVESAKSLVRKGKKSDIQSIIGEYKGFIFLRTASIDGYLSIDVISPDLKLYTTFIEKSDEVLSLKIRNGKLISCKKNDSDGPYVEISDINIQ